MTKRRLAPKEQQLVEDYLKELNRLQAMPIFDKMSLAEVAKHITSVMQEQVQKRAADLEAVAEIGIVFPDHLVVAHAKHLVPLWFRWKRFRWRLIEGDRQLAIADLTRRYRSRRKPSS